nr:class III extradiol ring-cleavage dioxygenase [Paenibacillus caui]
MFSEHGIAWATDAERGLDHGSRTMLRHLFPKADVPIVQVSVNPFLNPATQYNIGRVLRTLAELDILIIGSGVTVHNLRAVDWEARKQIRGRSHLTIGL